MPISEQQLIYNRQSVLGKIAAARQEFGCDWQVDLLAVSKTKPASAVACLYADGQRHFGENYLQDALPKIAALQHLPNINWHFIGQLQSNKTALIAQNFAWVHSVDRLKIARRLSAQRPDNLAALNICLQVDVDHSSMGSKAGVPISSACELARAVSELPNIQLRGLMCIPDLSPDFDMQLQIFSRLSKLFVDLNAQGFQLDTLSMGMSADMRAAIKAGSTMVRIGTDIFGAR